MAAKHFRNQNSMRRAGRGRGHDILVFTNLVTAKKTPKLHRAARRASIVKAASRLFSLQGFRGVTTRELANAAGISEPVLYEHFKTKRDLYTAIIEDKYSEGQCLLEKRLGCFGQGDDDRGFFLKLGQAICEFVTKDPSYSRLMLYAALEGHELADLSFKRNAAWFYSFIGGYIRRRQKQGAFRGLDALLVARSFVGMVYEYSLYELNIGFKIIKLSKKKTIEGMVDIFLNGIIAK
jgi:AcrR family transcriptional regulator